ncbi:hypothetical protein BJY04DRAFT_217425 [Aspergillus karnatakaensis]|uniref:uncharacterized protein n=1 Tax=Aspergillus karnatakaensis TaxID=1810916 RepID=UPI003CCD1B4E
MRATSLFSLFTAATAVLGQHYEFRKAYQLVPGTWIENLSPHFQSWYTRFTRLDRPEIMEVDTQHQHGGPRTIHTFKDATNATGLAEISSDTYAVTTLNQVGEDTTVTIWKFNAVNYTASKIIEDVPGTSFLNGLAAVNSQVVLASDSFDGGIYQIDLQRRTSQKVLSEVDSAAFGPGINGLRYQKGYLYYTNTLLGIFGRIEVTEATGSPIGDAVTLAEGDLLVGADDFALARDVPSAFVTNFEKNTIVRVYYAERFARVVVEGIPAPTTATFGLGTLLYVGTSGSEEVEGASIWSVSVPDVV